MIYFWTDSEGDWYYGAEDGITSGPFTFYEDAVKAFFSIRVVN